jgi:hypothetical protein
MNELSWLERISKKIPTFLENIKGEKRPGFYHYSLSGDYFGEKVKWGLGNAAFFLKIIYTLGLENEYKKQITDAIFFIKSFQNKKGIFSDNLVNLLSLPPRVFSSLRLHTVSNLYNQETDTAQSRQAVSALLLFGQKPDYLYQNIPISIEKVDGLLKSLFWQLPWSAGSHFSHLVFFLEHSGLENKTELIDYAINWVNGLQNSSDGFWYNDQTSLQQKIKGAMKIITGLKAVNKIQFDYVEKIIDTCLSAEHNTQACDNFNIVYVLKYCDQLTGSSYKHQEIINFVYHRLGIYQEYYFEKYGGFSFNIGSSGRRYYGALITRGKNEPDIHGTVLFLWGISLIVQVLGIEKNYNFKEFVT